MQANTRFSALPQNLIAGKQKFTSKTQDSQAEPKSLDADDIWLTGTRRYLGYADEIGEVVEHSPAVQKMFGNKLYSLPLIYKDRSAPVALGYVISLVYCGLNLISRAKMGWDKTKETDLSNTQRATKVGLDVVGLGLFHYFATMKLAPSLLHKVGSLIKTSVMTEEAVKHTRDLAKNHQPIKVLPEMFKAGLSKSVAKLLGGSELAARKLLSKAYTPVQMAVAIGLIPIISHPLDNLVQKVLDYTYRPLVGINKFQPTDAWYRFRSVPNVAFWGAASQAKQPVAQNIAPSEPLVANPVVPAPKVEHPALQSLPPIAAVSASQIRKKPRLFQAFVHNQPLALNNSIHTEHQPQLERALSNKFRQVVNRCLHTR